MTALAIISICALFLLVGFWALERAFKTARFYPAQPREAKSIIVKVGGKPVKITTRGGEQ